MRLYLSALLTIALALLPLGALASTTWVAEATASVQQYSHSTSTTGTESAPTTNPCAGTATDEGLCLEGVSGFTVTLEGTGTFTAGGYLAAYVWNPVSSAWYRDTDLDLYADSSLSSQSWAGFTVTVPKGGIAFIPTGIGSVAPEVYIISAKR